MAEPKVEGGVEKSWLSAVLKNQVPKPKSFDEKDLQSSGIAKKPTSKVQGVVQQFYFDLRDGLKAAKFTHEGEIVEKPEADMFDKWFENQGLARYQNKYQLMQIFNTILRALQLQEEPEYGEKSFQSALAKIAQRCLDEPEYLQKVEDAINEKYPGLVTPFRSAPTTEEMNNLELMQYQKDLNKVELDIESNIDQYSDKLQSIREAAKTDFETLATGLNQIVFFGVSCWELILYSTMSPYAPKVKINTIRHRPTMHVLLAGDVSTAKSTILWIVEVIAPKCTKFDETTKASFEGVAKPGNSDEIADGVIDNAKDGVIIIEEFVKKLADMPIFRRMMDSIKPIIIFKKGLRKEIEANVAVLAGCNPTDDFFREETSFRPQLPFKEGILSRFDVLIPLTATPIKTALFTDKLNLFGDSREPFNADEIKSKLQTISLGMRQIVRVVITEEQQVRIKSAFKAQNERDMRRALLKHRPLVILRDLENLTRLINVIASVNFAKKHKVDEDGSLHATDEDIDKAIQLWENLIELRIQLYQEESSRELLSISDEMIIYTSQQARDSPDGFCPISSLRQHFVNDTRKISQSSFYRELETMRNEKRIMQVGKREGKIQVMVRG